MERFSISIGQFLLGLYFFVPGISKFTTSDKLTAYMQSHDIVFAPQLLWFAGAASLIGGVLLMSGRHVKLVAYGFVVYVLLVNFTLHDFWTMSGDIAARETQNFVKKPGNNGRFTGRCWLCSLTSSVIKRVVAKRQIVRLI